MKTVRDVLDARSFPTFEKARDFLADVDGFPRARVTSVGDAFVIDLVPGIGVYLAPNLNPYADVGEVFSSETALQRVRSASAVTPKAPLTEEDRDRVQDDGSFIVPEVALYQGFHIDGDRRYQEK